MHVLLVSKDGSHINKSDTPLLSAFLDLEGGIWFDATFDFSNSRFFELISISLGVSKNRNSTVFYTNLFYSPEDIAVFSNPIGSLLKVCIMQSIPNNWIVFLHLSVSEEW